MILEKPRWDCNFTYVSFGLAIGYFLILLIIIGYLCRLLRSEAKRRAQKLFLGFATLQCIARSLFFTLWPLINHQACSIPSTNAGSNVWMDALGTAPAPFFLSAFSVNVFTFARIYHTVLDGQRGWFSALVVGLVVTNLAIYTAVLSDMAIHQSPVASTVAVGVLSTAAFLVSLGFVLYAVLIFFAVKDRVEAASPSSGVSRSVMVRANSNPMFKIVCVAVLCWVCFLVRVGLLPWIDSLRQGAYTIGTITLYFIFSEILPLCLMLFIFETAPPTRAFDEPLHNPLLDDQLGQSQDSHVDDPNFWHRSRDWEPDSPYTAASKAASSWQATATGSAGSRPARGSAHTNQRASVLGNKGSMSTGQPKNMQIPAGSNYDVEGPFGAYGSTSDSRVQGLGIPGRNSDSNSNSRIRSPQPSAFRRSYSQDNFYKHER